jgi:hypothetical protein
MAVMITAQTITGEVELHAQADWDAITATVVMIMDAPTSAMIMKRTSAVMAEAITAKGAATLVMSAVRKNVVGMKADAASHAAGAPRARTYAAATS